MSTPRGPRPPVQRATPARPEAKPSPERIEAHGAIAVSDGPAGVPVVSTVAPYDGAVLTCRKPFKLGGEKYTIGDLVPVDLIPRPESWVRTGFLQDPS